MNQIQLFNNPQFGNIRVVEIDNKPYLVGIDVANALGYKNPNDAITRHCRGYVKYAVPTKSGVQNMNVIPQGDIYRLAAKSELSGAEEFESWIFDEVLVSISKHGAYMTSETLEKAILSPDFLIQLATSLKDEQSKRIAAEKQLEKLQPKAALMDKILDSGEKIDIGQTAKILGLPFGRNTLFKKLRERGIFFKNRNEPKQEYLDRNYFELKEQWIERNNHDGFAIVKVLVTQKGLAYINKLLGGNKSDAKQAKVA